MTYSVDDVSIKNMKQSRGCADRSNWPDVTGTEEGLVKGKSARRKRKPEGLFFWARGLKLADCHQVDGNYRKSRFIEVRNRWKN